MWARVAEWAALPLNEQRTLTFSDGKLKGEAVAVLWRELLELRGATALACYADGAEAGVATITVNRVGAGEAWYVGALGDALIDTVVAARLEALGITGLLHAPEGVEVCARDVDECRIVFILNHTAVAQSLDLIDTYRDALSGALM